MNQTDLFTKVLKSVFNTGLIYTDEDPVPINIDIVGPIETGPYAPPINLSPTLRSVINWTPSYKERAVTPIIESHTEAPFKKPAEAPVYKGPPVTTPTTESIDRKSTVRPYKIAKWGINWGYQTPTQQEATPRTFFKIPSIRDRWHLKPPDKEHKPRENVSSSNGSSTNLENFLWVVLGGIVVLTLIAIFMKIGKPIRRARRHRQRLNAQPAVAATTRRQDPDDRYLDMGSLLRLTDTDTEPLCDDLPPPYSVCVPNTNKRDTEDPPPRFSACFVTYTNPKGKEPKVHMPQQEAIFKNDLRDVSIAMDESEDVGDAKTELILVNGRIVEKPKLHLNGNNETILTSDNNAEERRTRRTDLKGRVVRINNTNDTVRIY